jgi:hypothetical protein
MGGDGDECDDIGEGVVDVTVPDRGRTPAPTANLETGDTPWVVPEPEDDREGTPRTDAEGIRY